MTRRSSISGPPGTLELRQNGKASGEIIDIAEPLKMTFRVPLPPNVANGSAQLFGKVGRHSRKKHYWRLLELRLLQRHMPRPVWLRPPRKVRLSWTWNVWGVIDQDNLYYRGKALIDWLVAYEYLAGDSPDKLEYVHPPRQVMNRRDLHVEVTLEEIP